MTSTLIAGPGEEPVALADAKAWCRIDTDDDDALVTALIAAARLEVESFTGRALITQSWRLSLECPPGPVVMLPVIPVSAITAATADGEDIAVTLQGDAALLPDEGYETLSIDYTAGYGAAADVPADLKQAVLMLVAYWYDNRDGLTSRPAGLEAALRGYRQVAV
jgi:hypothetical protein